MTLHPDIIAACRAIDAAPEPVVLNYFGNKYGGLRVCTLAFDGSIEPKVTTYSISGFNMYASGPNVLDEFPYDLHRFRHTNLALHTSHVKRIRTLGMAYLKHGDLPPPMPGETSCRHDYMTAYLAYNPRVKQLLLDTGRFVDNPTTKRYRFKFDTVDNKTLLHAVTYQPEDPMHVIHRIKTDD